MCIWKFSKTYFSVFLPIFVRGFMHIKGPSCSTFLSFTIIITINIIVVIVLYAKFATIFHVDSLHDSNNIICHTYQCRILPETYIRLLILVLKVKSTTV